MLCLSRGTLVTQAILAPHSAKVHYGVGRHLACHSKGGGGFFSCMGVVFSVSWNLLYTVILFVKGEKTWNKLAVSMRGQVILGTS